MVIKKLDIEAVLKVGSYSSEQTILRIDTPEKCREYDYSYFGIEDVCDKVAFALSGFGLGRIAVVARGNGLAVIDCLSGKGFDVTHINI